ncbi:AAA family ATPase [Prauserella rugosa]|uniref:AAA domain-containing protein n=1 Tax=Prauserella rugosa TaxID=43354 RepID=A0A660CH01_9PSEU|nr:AAA family ATPase [Prauserella rugosa]KMS87931.1 hypothetical protein ACZ91_28550 [Streptomyces regensis]TWH20943.1 AAA domain-containing protein [Prauserella rugosa]
MTQEWISIKEAYERSLAEPEWVFPNTIAGSVTMIYGRSNSGKSYLVGEMLLALLAEGRKFLGLEPVDVDKAWRPAVLTTDPGALMEYGKRVFPLLPPDAPLFLRQIGRTAHEDRITALADEIIANGYNFVVVDNLMGITGDTNDVTAMTTVFDGLTKLTTVGIPVVVLHHESEKGFTVPGAPPMGASESVQKSRAWIQVRQTRRRGLRGGNVALVVQSNQLDRPEEIVAEPGPGPNYRVLKRGPWVAREDKPETEDKPKQNRADATKNKNARAADWLVANGQGLGVNAAAKELAKQFGDSDATWRDKLVSNGAVAQIVARAGEATSTVWKLRDA